MTPNAQRGLKPDGAAPAPQPERDRTGTELTLSLTSRHSRIGRSAVAQPMERPTWNEPVTGCPWWDEDRLRELLIERGLKYTDAAVELGCHPETVKKWARRYGIVREAPDAA